MACKLCVKGVFDRSKMRASVGGIMKERERRWVRGLGGMIGLADSQMAELWAIYYGLKMAWEREKTSVVVFTENREAIELIKNHDPAFAMASLIDMITTLLGEAWSYVDIQPIHADVNVAANAMAKYCLDGDGGINEMVDPPKAITHLI